MIYLDTRDPRPLYEQIVEKMTDLMVRGVLKEDDPIPSVRSLATDLSINPNTVQRAYLELDRLGYIYSVRGRGSFVSDIGRIRKEKQEKLFVELAALTARAASAGILAEDWAAAAKAGFSGEKNGGTNHD